MLALDLDATEHPFHIVRKTRCTLPPLLPPVPGTSAKGKYPHTFSRPTKAIVHIIHVYEQLTVCSVGYFLLSVLWYDLKNRKKISLFL